MMRALSVILFFSLSLSALSGTSEKVSCHCERDAIKVSSVLNDKIKIPEFSFVRDIIEGKVIKPKNDSFKAVKQLIVDGEQHCTATLIRPGVALTAAHCLDLLRPDELSIELSSKNKVIIQGFYPHPKYSDQDIGSVFDVAVITFSHDSSPRDTFMGLDYDSPKTQDKVELVGFGNGKIKSDYGTEQDGAGVKRYGTNSIEEINENGQIIIQSRKRQAAAISGDSGGPLIKEGKIIGVVSSTAYSKDRQATTIYTSIANPENRAFIEETLKKIDLK